MIFKAFMFMYRFEKLMVWLLKENKKALEWALSRSLKN